MNIDGRITQRALDFVLCIDTTRDVAPHIEKIKGAINKLRGEIVECFVAHGCEIINVRYKIIAFSDYKIKHADAIIESLFFEIPHDEPELDAFLDSIEMNEDCAEGSNVYEALVYAMRSQFVAGPLDRQIIFVFCGEKVLPIRSRRNFEGYPEDMPDMEGLYELWMCQSEKQMTLKERTKRLAIFAPHTSDVRRSIVDICNRSTYVPVDYEKGFDENFIDELFFPLGP